MIKNRILFILLFSFALIFVGISGYLMYNVNSLSAQIKENVETISFLTKVENGAYEQLSEFDFYAVSTTNSNAERLVEENLKIASQKKLRGISQDLRRLRRLTKVNISGQQQKNTSQTLFEIERECKKSMRSERKDNSRVSIHLSKYWHYTYWLIGVACVLSIVLAYTGYKVFASIVEMNGLKKLNALFLNNSIDVVVTCDKQGRIIEFNKAAEQAFGYSKKEIFKKPVSILYANHDQAYVVKEAINLNDIYKGEVLNHKKNGELFISQISANRLLDVKGKSVGSMGVSRDITKQKELETNFESIVNNVADIVYSCDFQGNFIFVNKTATEILGYGLDELIGRPFTDFILKEDIRKVTESYADQVKMRTPVSYLEFRVIKKNGEIITVGQTVRFVMSQIHKGHIIGVHGISRSIKERHKKDQSQ